MYILPPHFKSATNPVSYRDAYNDILQHHRRAPQTSASSIMIIVAPDVDALCAARMLETLLRQDNITHRIRPVAGLTALVDVKNELLDYHDLHTLILINIGAFLELPSEEWFGTFPEHLKIHVIDSQRPLNLSSLFGGGPAERIIVWDDGGIEKLKQEREAWLALEYDPDSDSDNSDDDSLDDEGVTEEEDEDGDRPRKRRRLNNGEAEQERPKRLSPDQRDEYEARMEKYYFNGTWYGQSTCGIIYILAIALERADNDLLWLTILGLTYQYLTSKISRDSYDFSHSLYLDEVVRLNPPLLSSKTIHPDDTSIRPSDELRFALFRHWNLYDAMYHSPYVASKMGIWKERGRKKLGGLLAKMGFSLAQCQQSYLHMDMDLKRELRDKMESIAPEYGLVELTYPSFARSFGFRSQPLCASDVVDGVSALLEAAGGIALNVEVEGGRNGGEWFGSGRQWAMKRDDNKENIPVRKDGVAVSRGGQGDADGKDGREVKEEWWKNNFWVAWDALGNDVELLNQSLKLSMTLQRAVIRQGSSLIDKQEIKTMRTFRLAMLKEGPDLSIFVHPGNLARLALWLVEALRDKFDPLAVGRSKKKSLPLVIACLDEKKGSYLVVGVTAAPEFGDIRKNQFGLAFLRAQEASKARTRHASFDTSIVEVNREDLQAFLTKLSLQ